MSSGPDGNPMTHLLNTIRSPFRRKRPHPAKRAPSEPTSRGWFWLQVTGALALLLGVFFWFTSASILQQPIHMDYGPADPAFASALGPTVGAEFTAGNAITTLVNGDAFFPAMLEAIRRAKKTVTLETYIWASGRVSDDFIAALGERARNGVKVHVLLDGMGTLKFKGEDRARLEQSGVQVMKYGREHWYQIKPNINHRTHRKLLIIDGRIGFTGGMCIDDSWLGDAKSEKTWRETQLRVEGPVVRQMQAVFATNWMQTTGTLLLGEDYYPVPERAAASLAQCFMSGPSERPEAVRVAHVLAIAAARKTIDIANAYFVPDNLAIEMLLDARSRGVRVRVIVPAINDSKIGRAASRSRWGKLMAAGVEFHQYQPAMFHVKSMVVDGMLVTVGSANFDNRSFAINDEVTLNVLDRAVGAENLRIFEADLKMSVPLTREEFEGRPLYNRIFDHICGVLRSQL
ncbi:MAG: phospholipase D-like domain-containing protein [Opitutaceae bacterium]|nr:phospholipase D-like domain-containing protein [Opitutaceae bacterium]